MSYNIPKIVELVLSVYSHHQLGSWMKQADIEASALIQKPFSEVLVAVVQAYIERGAIEGLLQGLEIQFPEKYRHFGPYNTAAAVVGVIVSVPDEDDGSMAIDRLIKEINQKLSKAVLVGDGCYEITLSRSVTQAEVSFLQRHYGQRYLIDAPVTYGTRAGDSSLNFYPL